MPLGKLTPTASHNKVLQAALQIRNTMADCILSDAAIQLIALRANTGAPVAQLARRLGIERTQAYVILGRPQAQELMAELAKGVLQGAAIEGLHTMTRLMRSKDHGLAYRAADAVMERAGLGLSTRATPDGARHNTVFQFAFGAPQAGAPGSGVALPKGEARMGPTAISPPAKDPSKTQAPAVGEGTAPAILEQHAESAPPDPGRRRELGEAER